MNGIIETIIEEPMPLPEKTDQERDHEWDLFLKFFPLIWARKNTILAKPEYFYVRFSTAYIGTTLTGMWHIPMGALILLWQDNKWKDTCPHCQGEVFIYAAGGSPLSGRHKYAGICAGCREQVTGRRESFGALMGPAWEMRKSYQNKRKILRTKSRWFSWGNGMIGEEIPDTVLADGVHAVDLAELIDELKKNADV